MIYRGGYYTVYHTPQGNYEVKHLEGTNAAYRYAFADDGHQLLSAQKSVDGNGQIYNDYNFTQDEMSNVLGALEAFHTVNAMHIQ